MSTLIFDRFFIKKIIIIIGWLFGIVVEFEKKKKMLERKDKGQGKKCDRWNHAKFEKKGGWKKKNKEILKNNILIKQ